MWSIAKRAVCGLIPRRHKHDSRPLSTSVYHGSRVKVTIFGSSSDLGPPLALLLHQSPRLSDLALVDRSTAASSALAGELNALDNRARVTAHAASGSDGEGARAALDGAHVVVLADGAIRVHGEARRARILKNAEKAAAVTRLIAEHCPQALVLVLSAPVSGVVPVVVEVARRAGLRRPERRVLGVPAAAKVRAASMVGTLLDEDAFRVTVPVTGGTSASASVPLLSQVQHQGRNALTKLEMGAVVSGVQSAGSRMARLRSQNSLPALGTAYAAARFVDNVVKAVLGEEGVREHAFVACNVVPGMAYMTVPVELNAGGVSRVQSLGTLTGPECALLRAAARLVQRDLDVANDMLATMFGFGSPDLPPSSVFGPQSSSWSSLALRNE